MPNIYTYVDYTGFLSEVVESDLNFAGTWRSTANYYRYDVVDYGAARYVCTTANTNTAPPFDRQFTTYWSIIAFTSTGTGSSGTNTGGGASVKMVEDVYSLAYRAYNIALTGTDLPTQGSLDPWVMQWIGHTYNIARAGTDAAHSADKWGRDAFSIAVAGTNAANSAWSYAGQAWTIAVAGTDAAASAQAAANQADSIAHQALDMAWAGTNLPHSVAGTVPKWVMDWLGQTYNIAVAGTNAANDAWDYAGQAWTLAVAGTNTAETASTNAASANTTAVQAFNIAVAGTNAANQSYSLATSALNTAWNGTSSFVLKTGDTMSGNLVAPNVQVSVGTVSTSSAISGTIFYDFTGPSYQKTTVDSNLCVSAKNMAEGREIAIVLVNTGSSKTLYFDGSITWFGSLPPSTISNKDVLIAMTSTGNTIRTVIGASRTAA